MFQLRICGVVYEESVVEHLWNTVTRDNMT